MGFEECTLLMSEANRYSQEIMVHYLASVGHALAIEVMPMSPRNDASTTMKGLTILVY